MTWNTGQFILLDLGINDSAMDTNGHPQLLQLIRGLKVIESTSIENVVLEDLLVAPIVKTVQQKPNLVQGQILQGDGPIDLSKNKRMWSDDQRDVEHTRHQRIQEWKSEWSEPGSVLVGLGLRLGLVTLERVGVWWRRCD